MMGWFRKQRRNNRRIQPKQPRQPWNWRLIGRRVTRSLAGSVVVAVAGFGIVKLLDPQTLPLHRLEVAGEFRHVSAEQVRDIAAPYAQYGFFAVDVAAMKRELTGMPWVYDVSVRREWPETLHVTVYEQVPLARWGDAGVVNHLGKLFFPAPETVPQDLPELLGPAGSETEMAGGLRVISHELLPLAMQVRELRLDERRSWRLVLDSGIEIVLGRQDTERRIKRFVEFYAGLRGERPASRVARVDMRYDNGFAAQWVAAENNAKNESG